MRDSVDVADPLHPIRTMGVMGHIIVIDRRFSLQCCLTSIEDEQQRERAKSDLHFGDHILAQSSIALDDLDTRRERKPVKPQKYTSTMQLWHIYLLDNTNFQKKSTTAGSC